MEASSLVIVGSGYRACPPVCECPPWEVCSRCEGVSFSAPASAKAPV